ncbi:hypothetical protein [Flavobacterium sp.]|uniref:hypothetical protein n=1 Tax=Flavobacterium sp. TaxID=239 RepID=UPI0039E480B0
MSFHVIDEFSLGLRITLGRFAQLLIKANRVLSAEDRVFFVNEKRPQNPAIAAKRRLNDGFDVF